MGMYCSTCRWETYGKYCWRCGSKLGDVNLRCDCENKLNLDAKFCTSCGRSVSKLIADALREREQMEFNFNQPTNREEGRDGENRSDDGGEGNEGNLAVL